MTLSVMSLTFLVGVFVPLEEILVRAAAVASLALILVQMIFEILDGCEQRRLREDIHGPQRRLEDGQRVNELTK